MKKSIIILGLLLTLTNILLNSRTVDSLQFEGVMRSYEYYIPQSYTNTEDVPLVIVLHGYFYDVSGMAIYSGFNVKAEEEGFIAVHPHGLIDLINNYYWNAGGSSLTYTNDDVGFLSTLLDLMINLYSIDTNKVYVVGHSMGAMMTYRLATELSNRIAGIGCIAGPMLVNPEEPERSVPIIHVHGMADPTIRFDGGNVNELIYPDMNLVLEMWRGWNNCNTKEDTVYNSGNVTGVTWYSDDGLGDISLYLLHDFGHEWPSMERGYWPATDFIWDFFKNGSPPTLDPIVTKIELIADNEIIKVSQNFPNPFSNTSTIHLEVRKQSHIIINVLNASGQLIKNMTDNTFTEGKYEIKMDSSGMDPGIYYYTIQYNDSLETKKMTIQ